MTLFVSISVVAFCCHWWYFGGMPTVSLRLSDSELSALREWAHGSRRSVQREIVFRLFDGAVTERGEVLRGNESDAGVRAPLASPADLPRSVTAAVPPVPHDVVMRAHMRLDRRAIECKNRVAAGEVCQVCGAEGR